MTTTQHPGISGVKPHGHEVNGSGLQRRNNIPPTAAG
jgi:hypothetical protein